MWQNETFTYTQLRLSKAKKNLKTHYCTTIWLCGKFVADFSSFFGPNGNIYFFFFLVSSLSLQQCRLVLCAVCVYLSNGSDYSSRRRRKRRKKKRYPRRRRTRPQDLGAKYPANAFDFNVVFFFSTIFFKKSPCFGASKLV